LRRYNPIINRKRAKEKKKSFKWVQIMAITPPESKKVSSERCRLSYVSANENISLHYLKDRSTCISNIPSHQVKLCRK
jgi:hypothetical protein